jgi:hypothetical protein
VPFYRVGREVGGGSNCALMAGVTESEGGGNYGLFKIGRVIGG